jgi:hypothetical protein
MNQQQSQFNNLMADSWIREVHPGVYESRGAPDQWRTQLLDLLREENTSAVLWTKDAPECTGIEQHSSSKYCWKIRSSLGSEKLLDTLFEGGWAIFFGDETLFDRNGYSPEFLPTDSRALLRLASDIRARALVVSWYDDAEWMVVRTD